MEKINIESLNIKEENIKMLEKIFPEIFTEGKINFDALKEALGNYIDPKEELYQFTWNGKSEAKKLSQTTSIGTLLPCKEKSLNWHKSENIYIEGDNLEVLKILQKSYNKKIKIIYIDPPYNTGNDFVYKDDFKDNIKNYKEQTNQEHKAKTESDGRFHTDWLNMIYPRIRLAKNLLTDDGVIFISINDKELANLIKICDEIFGERNFVANLIWTNNEGGGSSDSKFFKIKHEYILCYAKNIDTLTPINNIDIEDSDRYKLSDEYVSSRGKYQLVKLSSASLQYSKSLDYELHAPDGTSVYPSDNTDKNRAIWRWSKTKYEWGVENGFVQWKKDKNNKWQVYTKQYTNCDKDGNIVERSKKPLGFIDKYSSTQGSKEIFELFEGIKTFSYPKPTELIKYLLERFAYDKEAIVLDFFGGSGTTTQAVMEMNAKDNGNRKSIMIQLPELLNKNTEAYKNGYKTICDIAEERIRRVSKKIKEETTADIDYGLKVFKLDTSNIKIWNGESLEENNLNDYLLENINSIVDGRTNDDILYEILLKEGLMLSAQIEEKIINGKTIYSVNNGYMIVCLEEKIELDLAKEISKLKPEIIIFKDSGFVNENIKFNILQELKKYGINESKVKSI